MKDSSDKIGVTVKYYLLFYISTGYKKEEYLKLSRGSTLAQLLKDLGEKYGQDFSQRLWGEKGELSKTAWVLRNGTRINQNYLQEVLEEDDLIIITTPMLVGG